MRLALPIVVSVVTLASLACGTTPDDTVPKADECQISTDCEDGQICVDGECVTDPGTGGNGGRGPDVCHPECERGFTCIASDCVPNYTIEFIDPPTESGTTVRLVVEVRPRPGEEPVHVEDIQLSTRLRGIEIDAPRPKPIEGQDNRWELDFNLSHAQTAADHGARLEVTASLDGRQIEPASRSVIIDNLAPQLDLEALVTRVFKRDEKVEFRVTMNEPHAQGSRAFAYLTGEGQVPPPPPVGWIEGELVPKTEYIFTFSIDQRIPPTVLKGITGSLQVHLWASDLYGNAATVTPERGVIQVSREKWSADMATKIDTAPLIMRDGRLAILVGKSPQLGIFDMGTGNKIGLNVSGVNQASPKSLVQGRDDGLYVAESLALQRVALVGNMLQSPPAMRCVTPNGPAGMPALAEIDGKEVALLTLTDFEGSLAMVPPDCKVVVTPGMAASGSVPAITVDGAGKPVAFLGGRTTNPQLLKATLTAWSISDTATLSMLNGVAPVSYSVLTEQYLGIDDRTVVAGPRFQKMMASFEFTEFDTQPIEKLKILDGIPEVTKVGPPIISQNAVVFPTDQGLRALPRTGPWSQTAVFKGETPESPVFLAAAVAGKGDMIYAINTQGMLYALQYREDPAPKFDLVWKSQLGPGNQTFSAPLTLTCGGVLVAAASDTGKVYTIVTDSLGLDPLAPWPKFQHDLQNTGNATTLTDCP